jgi:branched-chain amino acid transport system substrate-binding protein
MVLYKKIPNAFVACLLGLLMGNVVVLLGACSGSPQSSQPAAEDAEIRVGIIAPLRGAYAESIGQPLVNAAELAVRQVNESGGVLVQGKRYTVKLSIGDSQNNPQVAVQVARKLIAQERVVALIGMPFSRIAIPVSAVAEAEGIPMISTTSTNPATTAGKAYVFRATFVDPLQAKALARFAFYEMSWQRVAMLYDVASAYNKGLAENFQQEFEALGGEVVAAETYTTDERDWSRQLKAIKQSRAEVLFLPNYAADVVAQVQQAHEHNLTLPLLGSDAWGAMPTTDLALLEGAFYTSHWHPGIANEQAQAFIAAYEQAYQQPLSGDDTALAYDALHMILLAMENQGEVSPQAIRDGLATMDYVGVTGHIVYANSGDPQRSVVLVQITEGKDIFYKQVDL